MDDRANERTDARIRIWCTLALNVTYGGKNFNDFPDNLPTKFRVFIGLCQILVFTFL